MLTPRTIRKAEAGGPVSPDTLRRLCEVLNLTLVSTLDLPREDLQRNLARRGFSPPPSERRWIDRSSPQSELLRRLRRPETARATVCLAGPSGVGKTAIAARVAGRLAGESDGPVVIWLRPGLFPDDHQIATVQTDIATALAISGDLPDRRRAPDGAFHASFRRALSARTEVLLVLDGVERIEVCDAFVGDGFEGVAIVTTRLRHIAANFGDDTFRVRGFTIEDSKDLLRRYIDPARLEADPQGAVRLHEVTAGLPRALHAAGHLLASEVFLRLDDCATRLTETPAACPDHDHGTRGLATTTALGSVLSPPAREALQRLQCFGTEPIPPGWAAAAIDCGETEARRYLSELASAYQIRLSAPLDDGGKPVEAQLETHVAQALATGAVDVDENVGVRVIDFATETAARASRELRLAEEFARRRGLWRRAVDFAHGDLPRLTELPECPDGLPDPATSGDGAGLSRLLIALEPLSGPSWIEDFGAWVGAGIVEARKRENRTEELRLLTMAGVWSAFGPNGMVPGLRWLERACELPCDAESARASVSAHVCHARSLTTLQRHDQAVAQLERALELASRHRLGEVTLAVLHNEMVAALTRSPVGSGGWAEAEARLDSALHMCAEAGADWPRCVMEANLATVRWKLGRDGSAAAVQASVRPLLESTGERDPLLRPMLWSHAAAAGIRLDEHSPAALADRAIETWREVIQTMPAERAPAAVWRMGNAIHFWQSENSLGQHPNRLSAGSTALTPLPAMTPQPLLHAATGIELALLLDLSPLVATFDDDFLELAIRFVTDSLGPHFIVSGWQATRASFDGEPPAQ